MTGRRGLSGRRGLTLAVLACGIAGAVALLAASRGWGSVTTARPAPLAPVVTHRTGSDWEPGLPALSVVALAGAGALLAVRNTVRVLLGGLLTVAGLGVIAFAAVPVADGAQPWWPVLSVLCGLVITAVGLLTIRDQRSWPAMGARYERPAKPVPTEQPRRSVSQAELWDALDRGEDPT